jgi:hypothetical protein
MPIRLGKPGDGLREVAVHETLGARWSVRDPSDRRSAALPTPSSGSPAFARVQDDQSSVNLRTPQFNQHRLMEPLGYVPPAEFEANYHRRRAGQAATA